MYMLINTKAKYNIKKDFTFITSHILTLSLTNLRYCHDAIAHINIIYIIEIKLIAC